MRSSVLVLGIFSGSWALSLTGFLARERRRGWPSLPGSGSSLAGSGDPSATDAAAGIEKTKSEHSIVPGVYLIVFKKKKLLLDTFAVPQGTLGQHGEAVLKPAAATMTQEWVILPVKNVPEEEYTIQNRATGENLQPPGAEGIEVQSGVRKGGWKLVGSNELGFNIASKHSGSVLNILSTDAAELMGSAPMYAALGPAPTGDFAPGAWELDLIHSLPPNADATLGFMPLLAGGLASKHEAIPEGVYKVVDSVTKWPMCAYTDPSQGVGDYEAHLAADCDQEWFVIAAEPEPGNPDAALDPPKIYELREGVSGALLDAYMFGTFGSHLRTDLHTIAQRWFFSPVDEAGSNLYAIGHASDLRWLSVGAGVVTTQQEHVWELEFLRGLPPMPESTACKTVCDGDFNCGQQDDGCGGVLECGTCDALDVCQENVCVCVPYSCEANMCGMVPDGCGTSQDCGGCGEGLNCNEETHACTAGPVLPPVANVSNATLPFETTPAPPPLPPTTPCPACDSCCDIPAPNVTVVANVTNVSKPQPPPTTTTTTTTTADDMALLKQLAPGILSHLRGIFADAAAASIHDYPVNTTTAREAAWDALTVDNIVAAAHTVELTAPQQADIHSRAFKKSQAVFNQTMAQQVVNVDVLPTFMRNVSAVENVSRLMIAVADPPTFEVATEEAGENASAVATDAVMEELDSYKSEVAAKAYKSVRATTDRIAGDIAVNSLTYNLEENIKSKVEFDPASVMTTTKKNLADKQVVQAVADEISSLITLRAQNASRVNLTTA